MQNKKMTRRQFLEMVAKVPLLVGIAALFYPMGRFMRPTIKPLQIFPPPEKPLNKDQVVATEAELSTPWSYKEFIFEQETVEYTRFGRQNSRIPGYLVRLDDAATKTNRGEKYAAFSRICTHLGCIFEYKTNPTDVKNGFNYDPKPGEIVFACPCHLSVYSLNTWDDASQSVGKVVSGPAPRAPRKFTFKVSGGNIVITGMEAGGIA